MILKPITTTGGTVMVAQLKKAEEESSEAVKTGFHPRWSSLCRLGFFMYQA
jgi:hypothetical protein